MKSPKCPICGKPQTPHYRPFCSRRCADVDLQRWLSGAYVVRASDDDDSEGAAGAGGEED
jgi:endogenous inhibitor of DNA gyrase (YacG/DUF329 family)